jgi:hypothetical protein
MGIGKRVVGKEELYRFGYGYAFFEISNGGPVEVARILEQTGKAGVEEGRTQQQFQNVQGLAAGFPLVDFSRCGKKEAGNAEKNRNRKPADRFHGQTDFRGDAASGYIIMNDYNGNAGKALYAVDAGISLFTHGRPLVF